MANRAAPQLIFGARPHPSAAADVHQESVQVPPYQVQAVVPPSVFFIEGHEDSVVGG